MSIKKDHRGFSLVEMIVVIAILGILAGASVSLIGHIRVANHEKVVKSISSALSKQQAQTMSKQTKPYLYIYEIDSQYYLCMSTTDVSAFDGSFMTKSAGTSLGKGFSIYAEDASGARTLIGGSNIIKVAYKRDGSFQPSACTCTSIVVTASSATATKIKLIQASGKHVVSME